MSRQRRWKPPPCQSGKVSYRTQGRALAAIESIRRANAQAAVPTDEAPQGAYKHSCGAWHITRQEGIYR
jgi:hypothetical protein